MNLNDLITLEWGKHGQTVHRLHHFMNFSHVSVSSRLRRDGCTTFENNKKQNRVAKSELTEFDEYPWGS